MAVYRIYDHGEEINRIVADEDFVKMYCMEHGYDYKLEMPPEQAEPSTGSTPEPDIESKISVLTAAAQAYALTAVNIPDTQALEMSTLFPTWGEVLEQGAELAHGRVISDNGRLYRVVQAVTPQAHQAPHDDGMLAIYRPIDKSHAGTLEDPIPWVYGMDCLAGTYYSYSGAVYRVADGGDMIPCTWPPDTAMWQWEAVQDAASGA